MSLKREVAEERRAFNSKWEFIDYFVIFPTAAHRALFKLLQAFNLWTTLLY